MERERDVPEHRPDRRIYSYAEADRIARVSRGTAKRWITGYSYTREGERLTSPAVTSGEYEERSPGVTFPELIEVAGIARLREIGLSLRAIRGIVDECRRHFRASQPFAELRFKTDGREVFVQVNERDLVGIGPISSRRLQRAWDEVLAPFLESVDFQDGVAHRWWPDGHDAGVVLDPDFGLGAPVVAGTGVRTEIIHELFLAAESPETIADDFNLRVEDVLAAIRFEARRDQSLLAA